MTPSMFSLSHERGARDFARNQANPAASMLLLSARMEAVASVISWHRILRVLPALVIAQLEIDQRE